MADINDFVNDLQDRMDKETSALYGQKAYDRWRNPPNMGEPPQTNCRGSMTGECGDNITIFLNIEDDMVCQSGFQTTGCGSSLICGSMAAELALNKHSDALSAITGKVILHRLGGLPDDDAHCASLAANALQEAVGDYYKRTLRMEKEK
ncbi:MAG: iron-sulfur cluster assembly scaffold protein [Proteobacteria bacterium]|nr:iron-sulfur cluster assembly scaffold protein [Pseudomonadota bacterium]